MMMQGSFCDQRASHSATFGEYLRLRTAELGLKNKEIAEALGYPKPNVISMLKAGEMNLPLGKVAAAARVLEVDALHLLRLVACESSPEILEVLEQAIGQPILTLHEISLIAFVRAEVGAANVPLADDLRFVELVRPLLRQLRSEHAADSQARG
jgi:transcriptional regulator with XRE-family HTH domain